MSSGRVFFQDVEDDSKVKEADSLMQVRDFIATRCQTDQTKKLACLQAELSLARKSAFSRLLFDFCSNLVAQLCANVLLF